MPYLEKISHIWLEGALWFCAFLFAFSLMAKVTPCNKNQPIFREGFATDILYFFLLPVASRFVRLFYIGAGAYFLFYGATKEQAEQYLLNGHGPLAAVPIWVQAALIFIISDFVLYWTHRWFHSARMWPFHAIHHSPQQVDWLSTYRFHPVNVWLTFTLLDAIILLVGFSPAAVALLIPVNTLYSAMVHANLNWTFGPFRYLFASPVFHRWHHTSQQEGMNKNFAPTFPLLDVVFGTYYMPEGRIPEIYGTPGTPVPEGFFAQLAWPFRKN